MDSNRPTMQFDKLPAERKAEPSAFDLLGRLSDLPELLEHDRLILGRDAVAGVRHGDFDHRVDDASPHLDLAAGRCELHRV